MVIKDINIHEHKINPKYGNIKSYVKRCKRILNGEISTNISPTECLDIINNTLISLEQEHEKFITELKHKIKQYGNKQIRF